MFQETEKNSNTFIRGKGAKYLSTEWRFLLALTVFFFLLYKTRKAFILGKILEFRLMPN